MIARTQRVSNGVSILRCAVSSYSLRLGEFYPAVRTFIKQNPTTNMMTPRSRSAPCASPPTGRPSSAVVLSHRPGAWRARASRTGRSPTGGWRRRARERA